MVRITATSKNGVEEIIIADYFGGNFWNHYTKISKNENLGSLPERAIHIDCPPLATNEPPLAFIYSDVLLRAASLGETFASAMQLYGNTGNNIFVAKMNPCMTREWGYKVEASQTESKLRFFDFLTFPFEIIVQKFQPTVITVTSSRLWTSNIFDVSIFSSVMQVAGAAAHTFDYHLSEVYGNTGNPVEVHTFGKCNQ